MSKWARPARPAWAQPREHDTSTTQHGGDRATGQPDTMDGKCLGRYLDMEARH
jgi:hypothetical protein